ncbi:gallidermin/nisin family lantibiotic [Nocardia sp. NPDC019395]|uniref:gallidermin/nisin family lantibiotic n=1 Tax=Nocardia sp. NPDC019395 TaxID=3154686 RepID=UPI0033E2DDE0
MSEFDLDLQVRSLTNPASAPLTRVTSKSLCTPGCETGPLQGCHVHTATCGCHISK